MENQLAGYFPTTPKAKIGTAVVLAVLGYVAYLAFVKKK